MKVMFHNISSDDALYPELKPHLALFIDITGDMSHD